MAQKTPTLLQGCLISASGFVLMIASCFGAVISSEKFDSVLLVYVLMLAVLLGFLAWMIGGVQFLYRLTQRAPWTAPPETTTPTPDDSIPKE